MPPKVEICLVKLGITGKAHRIVKFDLPVAISHQAGITQFLERAVEVNGSHAGNIRKLLLAEG